MVSIHTKIGLGLISIVFILGILSSMQVPIPLASSTRAFTPTHGALPLNGSYIDIPVIQGMTHFFVMYTQITFRVTTESGEEIQGNAMLIYETTDGQISGQVPYTNWDFYTAGGSSEDFRSFSISSKYASSKFNLYLRINQFSPTPQPANVDYVKVYIIYWFWAMVVPYMSFFTGIIILVGGFIYNRRPSKRRKGAPQPVGWEPSLQWGSSTTRDQQPSPKKESRFKIPKLPKKPSFKRAEKPVGATKAPTRPTGGQMACKYCGKAVTPGAFFCPHCYGKLK